MPFCQSTPVPDTLSPCRKSQAFALALALGHRLRRPLAGYDRRRFHFLQPLSQLFTTGTPAPPQPSSKPHQGEGSMLKAQAKGQGNVQSVRPRTSTWPGPLRPRCAGSASEAAAELLRAAAEAEG